MIFEEKPQNYNFWNCILERSIMTYTLVDSGYMMWDCKPSSCLLQALFRKDKFTIDITLLTELSIARPWVDLQSFVHSRQVLHWEKLAWQTGTQYQINISDFLQRWRRRCRVLLFALLTSTANIHDRKRHSCLGNWLYWGTLIILQSEKTFLIKHNTRHFSISAQKTFEKKRRQVCFWNPIS